MSIKGQSAELPQVRRLPLTHFTGKKKSPYLRCSIQDIRAEIIAVFLQLDDTDLTNPATGFPFSVMQS